MAIDTSALNTHSAGRDAIRSARTTEARRDDTQRDNAAPRSRPSDQIDISDRARLLSKMAQLPPVRAELVARIKEEIAAGTYDDENSAAYAERLDGAARGLLADLR